MIAEIKRKKTITHAAYAKTLYTYAPNNGMPWPESRLQEYGIRAELVPPPLWKLSTRVRWERRQDQAYRQTGRKESKASGEQDHKTLMDNGEVIPQFAAYTDVEPELQISEEYRTIPSKEQRIAARRGRIVGVSMAARLRPGSTRKEITCIGRYISVCTTG